MLARQTLLLLFMLTTAAACVNTTAQQASRERADRPNIVIIFTDDQGWADMGTQGAEGFRTPNMDRLASEGIRFTDF